MTIVGIHPEDLFDKLLCGELLPAERERLRAHLGSCEVCRFEYEARLDFQQEALELATSSGPPALPLRPLVGVEAPVVVPLPPRRRSRRLVWALAAAALISASGALASSLNRTPWAAVSVPWLHGSAPVERLTSASTAPDAVRAAAAAVAASARVDRAEPVAVEVALPRLEEPHPRAGGKRQAPVVAAPLTLASTADMPDEASNGPPAKEAPSAAKLFGEANQARRSGDVGRASGLYHLLQDQFPSSPEAELSRVTLALLLLDNGDAQGALSGFERYLAGSSRGLEAEALVGRARALGRLGRRDLEAAAWREVENKYPRSVYGRQAAERLLALGQP